MKILNFTLFIVAMISFIIFLSSIFDYCNSKKNLWSIKNGLRIENSLLQKKVLNAEIIGSRRRKMPSENYQENYDRFGKKNVYHDSEYQNLLFSNDSLFMILMRLTSHTSIYSDKFYILKDVESNNVYLASSDGIGMKAEAYQLIINDVEFKVNYSGTYTIPKADTISIDFKKYTLDYCKNTIDTIHITREFIP